MRNRIENALVIGVSLTLAACGGGGGGVASTPTPVATPAPTPTPTPAPTPVDDTITLTEKLTVRQNGVDYYQSGDYIAYVNNWGAESMGIPKIDFSQTVRLSKSAFPNKTLVTWKYPDQPYGNGAIVYGYPMIAWGKTTLSLSGYNTNNVLAKIGDIAELTQKYDVTLTGDPKYNNLMSDMWMWDHITGKIAGEITFNVKPSDHILYWGSPNNYFGQQPGAHSFQFSQDGNQYNMLVSTSSANSGLETIPGSKMIIIIPTDGSQKTAGTIDWAQVFKILLDAKDIDPNWLIKGIEMGVEVQAGSGSMLVNNFNVTLKLKGQQVQAMVITAVNTTTTASHVNAATLQQMLNAAAANPQTPTYGFSQGNAGIGTNMRLSNRLTIGTSTVFAPNGYTLASNLVWRNKNTHALFMTGTGNQRIQNTNTQSTFALVEAGTAIPTKFASFEPYARLGHTRFTSAVANLSSTRLTGGMNVYVPITRSLMSRMSGEASHDFSGKGTARASLNGITGTAPINISGVEYTGSVNLSRKLTETTYAQMEVGTRKNVIGTNNYASAGIGLSF